MKNNSGFAILEVMIAIVIAGILTTGIYGLQIYNLATEQQSLTKQLLVQSATSIANQINSNISYCNTGMTQRLAGCNIILSYYNETSYLAHNSGSTTCCTSLCTDSELASCILTKWKYTIRTDMNLPSKNIHAMICKDNSWVTPTMSNGNCNNAGGLLIKIAWEGRAVESWLGSNNYIIFPVIGR